MFFVYLLRSVKDASFYIGQTGDVEKRLERHNRGFVKSTKNRLPWKLVGYEQFLTREQARWREYQLKHRSSEKKRFIAKLCACSSAD